MSPEQDEPIIVNWIRWLILIVVVIFGAVFMVAVAPSIWRAWIVWLFK